MKRKTELPELLAPAGDFDCLVAAVNAGADAVYVGGKRFGARAYAKNFDADEISRAVTYCHLHGAKLYVTLNTLIYDTELADAVAYAAQLYALGVDALIVADLGVIAAIRAAVPGLELHASTQMSVHNAAGADLAADFGCTRVVLARELSAENIRETVEKCRPEVEIFLHGALCVCHSGQCLFSSLVGGRSGNRGECAQPCRLPYNGKYPLSLRDLSLASHIRELIDSGVASLKIEGRMKSPDYVYKVTSVYRRLLDEGRNATENEKKMLADAFSRGGFTDGYYRGDPFSPMTGVRSDEDKARTKDTEDKTSVAQPIRKRVYAAVTILADKPCGMTLFSDDGLSVTVTGETPAEAKNAPLDEAGVKARLSKMGQTFLSLNATDISLTLGEGLNLSPASLNALRRAATEAYEKAVQGERVAPVSNFAPIGSARNFTRPRTTAVFFFPENMTRDAVSHFDTAFVPLWRFGEIPDGLPLDRIGVYLPPVIPENEWTAVSEMLDAAIARGIRKALAPGLGAIALAKKKGMTLYGDFRLNVYNAESAAVYRSLGVEYLLASPELTSREAEAVADGQIVYGRIPLMLTERCFMKENFGCDKCSRAAFTDRKGARFPVLREYPHRNLILNAAVTYMADKPREIGKIGKHFLFTTESAAEIAQILAAYRKEEKAPEGIIFRRIGKRKPE